MLLPNPLLDLIDRSVQVANRPPIESVQNVACGCRVRDPGSAKNAPDRFAELKVGDVFDRRPSGEEAVDVSQTMVGLPVRAMEPEVLVDRSISPEAADQPGREGETAERR